MLGNILQIPLENQFKTFTGWGNVYGDVVYAQLFQQPLVIIGSLRAAQELMEKRGAIYSDRPRFVLLQEIFGFKPITSLIRSDDQWRQQRRWMQDALSTYNTIRSYRPLQRNEVNKLIARFATSPDSFFTHVQSYGSNFTLEIGYGLDETFAKEKFDHIAEKALAAMFQSGSIVATLIDFFPFLRYVPSWMPGAGGHFQRHASNTRHIVRQMLELPYETLRENMDSGRYRRSFASTLINKKFNGQMTPQQEDSIKGATSTIWMAGAETTSVVLLTFILMMVLHPDVAAKVQTEIDSVTGGERLPELEDRKHLPYLECVLMEVYRWNPPLPLSVSHRLMQNDVYRDYFIPEGSTIIPNVWAMSRDSSIYPDPEAFRPERFEEMGPDTLKAADPKKYIFGFGRRICSGRTIADLNFWIGAANIMATMDIKKAIDSAGNEIQPTVSFVLGISSLPRPFLCSIRPRSSLAADVAAQIGTSELHA